MIKKTAMNESWNEIAKIAVASISNIKIPAMEKLDTRSFSFSDNIEIINTVIIIKARTAEGENPENVTYNNKGKRVNMPDIFFAVPETLHLG